MIENLKEISADIRAAFVGTDEVREMAYKISREITRTCATGIRAVHREEWEEAKTLIDEARHQVKKLVDSTETQPQIYWAGYTQDCLKEYVEAELTYALVRNLPLKGHKELHVSAAAWLNGLAEASTELRRRILDIIRHGHHAEAERLLEVMDEVYSQLVTFDFRDAITGGLRRRTDTVRSVLERTRGDMTTSLRQEQLEAALQRLEAKVQQ